MLGEGSLCLDTRDHLRSTHPGLHLLKPGPVVEDLKLQEDLAYPVVIADHWLGLFSPQHKGLLLEEFHWLLQPLEQLPGPQDLPSDGRLVPSQRRIIFLFRIQLRNQVNLSPKILKNDLVFFLNTKVRYIQSDWEKKSTKFWINEKNVCTNLIY